MGGANKPSHICSGRTCMFCRVIEKPTRMGALPNQRASLDEHVLSRVRELEQRALLSGAQTNVSSTKTEEIERLALLDTLTDLYNSRTFIKEVKDELKRAKRYKRPLTVCLVAIDGIRDISMQYGALTSDGVLQKAAGIVRGAIRDVDIPARYSAEEFAIMFPETNASGAAIVAERIRQRSSGHVITHNWHNLRISLSFGLAAFPTHGREHDEIINEAIEALKMALRQGGDQVCVG